jgi:threonylcarbamoyladenosine tRNA methylthiotransferase MtaB
MNIYLDTIGCRLNQSEIESFARQFRAAGHTLVASAAQADLVVINTCTVTAQAAADSRQKIRQAARRGSAQIVVTGCWASLEPQAAAALPGVRQVVANLDKDALVSNLLQCSPEEDEQSLLPRQPLPGTHQRTRAFIKAQDGCDNRCTYCITCLARGPSRSRSVADIRRDVAAALAGGTREIVLTGVHLGAWGADLQPVGKLRDLLQAVLTEPDLPRLRLSSLEPWDLEPDFFELWQDARLCRHLHLPLQSGCAETLRRMARKVTPQAYAELVTTARAAIPGLAITTDVIVGFPGENEAEFNASLEFIQCMEFARGHVFTYSARPGTAAARMPGQVPNSRRKQRSQQLIRFFAEAEQRYQAQFIGQQLPVVWESAQLCADRTWRLSGLTSNYLRVTAQSPENLWNQVSPVELVAVCEGGMQGIICDRSPRKP